ncbi:cuticle protein 7-like [Penaeus chinensis]|uniref:cuticle protein 7-like n=1 Tax=Penaeus chinensis TaxID=139456 RepID=UPI001FB73CC3|nr:cuticle protein 7-like [Penaeus chinensis]
MGKAVPSFLRINLEAKSWCNQYCCSKNAVENSIYTYFLIEQVLVLFTVVAVAFGSTVPSYNTPAPSYSAPAPSYRGPAQYNFNYAVKDDYSGNDYNHQENRNGYDTQGAYYVLLPDGRVQRVAYAVNGDSGYVAEVTYEGEAQYSAYQPTPSRTYQPAPSYA